MSDNIIICIKDIIKNSFDEYALETGLYLKTKIKKQSKVIVLTMGNNCNNTDYILRTAIAKGADEAYLLSDGSFQGSDSIATAYILATAIKVLIKTYTIIICGEKTTDFGTGNVGAAIAAMLKIPYIAYVNKIGSIHNNTIIVERILDNMCDIMKSPFPILFTVLKNMYTPHIPSIRSKIMAKQYIIKSFNALDLDIDTTKVGINGSPTQIVKKNNSIKHKQKFFSGNVKDIVSKFLKSLKHYV
ncbi:MAG: electron transfer flavoprotein subunit beta/FixA family protein [Endomicrobium sp.]|jgi:electron transfer flavoprotein beta subunit|nr:electron transfer flavoprotein subunit beta/FixA family protein [Endomicrobium sp.]